MDANVYEVNRIEHHYLPTCPCAECHSERSRRGMNHVTDSRLRSVPLNVAYVLGFFRKRSPLGSVARGLMEREKE